MMLKTDDVLVVIPAYNEDRSVGQVVSGVRSRGFNCLVIDDGSSDDTAQVARDAGAIVLRLKNNLGVGGALRAGFRFAVEGRFKAVVQVDADGQHPIAGIDQLIDATNNSRAHLVIGSRFLGTERSMQVGAMRRIVMILLSRSASRAARTQVTDSTSGFRLIREPLLGQFAQSFPTNYLGDTYEAVVTAGRAGYDIMEVPATMIDREFGTSSATTSQAVTLTLKALAVSLLRVHFQIARVSDLPTEDRL